MNAKRILIVEDELLIAEDIKLILGKYKYEVCGIISSGESAVQEAKNLNPDLILMDIMLEKKMNGLQASREISKIFSVPFVFLTAYADDESITKALTADSYGYIVKPFEERELKATLELAFYKFQTERMLRESEEKYKLIFNNIQDVYLEIDPNGKILEISPSIQRFSDQKRSGLLTKDISNLIMDKDVADELLSRVSVEKQLEDFEIEIDDGNHIPIQCSISCSLISEMQADQKIVCSLRDISHRKKLEKKIIYTERLAGIGQLAAGIAHEIRNPLGIISSSIQYCLQKFDIPANLYQYLEIIQRNSENANSIIKELLEFASPREIKLTKSHLPAILNSALSMIEARSKQSGVTIKTNIANDLPAVMLDHNWIQQAFVNIIINALEAMPSGGELTLQCCRQDREISISFCDNGEGISEADIKKLFDPFFTTKPEGTGLGLAMVYQIISAHNGTIEIESRLGEGSCFLISLPMDSERKI